MIKKINAYTLSEVLVVLLLTSIIAGMAFSVLSMVQKQLFSVQKNMDIKADFRQLEQSLTLDFNKYHNQFDVISIIGLFEFLSDQEILDLLTNLKIMLKPAGKIVASTLNFNSYLKILLYFQYSFGKVNYKNEHINHIGFTKMRNLLERTDYSSFKIEKFMNVGVSFSIFKNSLGIKAHDFIEKLFNKNFGALIFVELNN